MQNQTLQLKNATNKAQIHPLNRQAQVGTVGALTHNQVVPAVASIAPQHFSIIIASKDEKQMYREATATI